MRWSARALFRSAVAGTAGAPEPSG
jgi:hypothetical protein